MQSWCGLLLYSWSVTLFTDSCFVYSVACWHVAQLSSANELRVVQLTVAERTHSFPEEYLRQFVLFLNALRAAENPPQIPIQRVQFYFVVPHGYQRQFQVPYPQDWNIGHSDWASVLPDLPNNTFVAGFIRTG